MLPRAGPQRGTAARWSVPLCTLTEIIAVTEPTTMPDGQQDNWTVRFLRDPSAYVTFVTLSVLGAWGLALIGRPGLALICAIFSVLFLTDLISMYGWDRLERYFDERAEVSGSETESKRDLAPPAVSTTTKVAVVLGTILFLWLVLIGAVVSYVFT